MLKYEHNSQIANAKKKWLNKMTEKKIGKKVDVCFV
jgi:hypothetical protein